MGLAVIRPLPIQEKQKNAHIVHTQKRIRTRDTSVKAVDTSFRPFTHGAIEKKPIGHANYQPVSSELLPL